jgi:hypothetical protein
MKKAIQINHKVIVSLFFILYFCLGIIAFSDYGISTDELTQRGIGKVVLKYMFNSDQEMLTFKDKYYGPIVEILLVAVERAFRLENDPRAIYLMRHLLIFLMFYAGVFFFYLLCTYRFSSWKIGMLGSLFLVLSPRIFADSFYNSKDIPFLAMLIVCMYTLSRYLENNTLSRAAVHAIASALLIDIRIPGIMLPFITIFFVFADLIFGNKRKVKIKITLMSLIVYTSVLILCTILFWPVLWKNPLINFINAFKEMSNYPWTGYNLYLGNQLRGGSALPWHYIPVWLIITTPPMYVFFALIGIIVSLKSFIVNPRRYYFENRNDLVFIIWLFMPIAAVTIFHSVLYNAWRQMFFVYPAFLLLSLIGLTSTFGYIGDKFQGIMYKIINTALICFVFFGTLSTMYFMAKNHPYQNLYFNKLTGGIRGAKNRFDMDYWGLSYRQGLEYILKTDTDNPIPFATFYPNGKNNVLILPEEQRNRLLNVREINNARYFLTNFRGYRTSMDNEYPYEKYFSAKIDGVEILVVYKIRD